MILLEHGPDGPALFDGAEGFVTVYEREDVGPALAQLDAARARGKWVAGYLTYEAGLAFEPRLAGLRTEAEAPLLAFGIYSGPAPMPTLSPNEVQIAPIRPRITRQAYDTAFAKVKSYIAAGDCYQINLTFPLESRLLKGTPLDLYAALSRQKVGFGAYLDLGGPVLVSRSPELFLRLDAGGRIEARPMKGTAPRGTDPVEDAELAERLFHSPKDRAENLMIVDLLRNDISRLSQVGSVKVPELFHVESYATVHQMVSRITGQLTSPASLQTLMPPLFPCGSITGAPKIRAMEIINEVEPFARGAYCGAIGWMAPDGSACFNVAIRTLTVTGDQITLNVGGGVTHDSTADGEWEEALWKARYVKGLIEPGLTLIETLGWTGTEFPRLGLHMARLARSAALLGWAVDPVAAQAALQRLCAADTSPNAPDTQPGGHTRGGSRRAACDQADMAVDPRPPSPNFARPLAPRKNQPPRDL